MKQLNVGIIDESKEEKDRRQDLSEKCRVGLVGQG